MLVDIVLYISEGLLNEISVLNGHHLADVCAALRLCSYCGDIKPVNKYTGDLWYVSNICA